jgi:hypothetical protein
LCEENNSNNIDYNKNRKNKKAAKKPIISSTQILLEVNNTKSTHEELSIEGIKFYYYSFKFAYDLECNDYIINASYLTNQDVSKVFNVIVTTVKSKIKINKIYHPRSEEETTKVLSRLSRFFDIRKKPVINNNSAKTKTDNASNTNIVNELNSSNNNNSNTADIMIVDEPNSRDLLNNNITEINNNNNKTPPLIQTNRYKYPDNATSREPVRNRRKSIEPNGEININSNNLLNHRISIWWKSEAKYFSGTIVKHIQQNEYEVLYDDDPDDTVEENLSLVKYYLNNNSKVIFNNDNNTRKRKREISNEQSSKKKKLSNTI